MMFKYAIIYTLVYSYYFFPKVTFLSENSSLNMIVEREILFSQILTIGVSLPIMIDCLRLICTILKKLWSKTTEFINYKS